MKCDKYIYIGYLKSGQLANHATSQWKDDDTVAYQQKYNSLSGT